VLASFNNFEPKDAIKSLQKYFWLLEDKYKQNLSAERREREFH
jgi:hypothetical protein